MPAASPADKGPLEIGLLLGDGEEEDVPTLGDPKATAARDVMRSIEKKDRTAFSSALERFVNACIEEPAPAEEE